MKHKWYSERMKEFHIKNKLNKFLVYHWFYTGWASGWSPSSLRWGGIGIAPYSDIGVVKERYDIEGWEIKEGLRPSERFMLKMIRIQKPKSNVAIKLIQENLTENVAKDIENFLRPEGYNHKKDQRIWNSRAGG